MSERCFASVEYSVVHQEIGYVIDEFGRKIDPAPDWWSGFQIAATTIKGSVACSSCIFGIAEVITVGNSKNEALDQARDRVLKFLLDNCESGKMIK